MELSLAHGPDADDVGLGQDGEGVVVFVPSQVVSSWGLVAGEFEDGLSLSI